METGPERLVLVTVDELVTVVLPCVVETKDEDVDVDVDPPYVCVKTRAEVTAETKKKTKSKAFMFNFLIQDSKRWKTFA